MPDRFEREIDEILKKIDDFPQGAARRRRQQNDLGNRIGAVQRSWATRIAHISVPQVMLIACGLILFSYFILRYTFEEVWVYGLTLGLILFFTAFALSLRGSSGRAREPYFRGRPRSAYEASVPSWPDRLRRWWRQRRYRR